VKRLVMPVQTSYEIDSRNCYSSPYVQLLFVRIGQNFLLSSTKALAHGASPNAGLELGIWVISQLRRQHCWPGAGTGGPQHHGLSSTTALSVSAGGVACQARST
jgi:hypothetical protein